MVAGRAERKKKRKEKGQRAQVREIRIGSEYRRGRRTLRRDRRMGRKKHITRDTAEQLGGLAT
jgi:ribosome assembly protein YihI (activator of Der GTPase)